ncbi:MAG TPA: serine hydrolase domain-containing protein [Thermoanaerobaculia bacterium]|nr:serine hydrolase domain-containing protein [Thermoanaerobaculia bacterium]
MRGETRHRQTSTRGAAARRRRAALDLVFLVLLLAAAAACRPAGAGSRGEVHGPLGESLDRFFSRLEAFGFSGSALVAQGGRVVLDKGYGLAGREHGRPYTARTMFDIASISKQFTAAAILKLEQEGRLRVEDPIGKFLGAVPADKAPITLHMLLTHTAGLPDVLGGEYEPVSRQELVRRALAADLVHVPGRRFWYSNAGYSLLAAVVEIASGEPYEKYLKERLWQPAGMRHTGFHLPDREEVAHGYTPDGDWGTPLDHPWLPDGPYWNLRGNGGILSTTGDLYRWHRALAGDAILSASEREKYIHPWVSQGRAAHASYGYGWAIEEGPKGGRKVSHIGGNLVFDSDFRRYLDSDVVIVLSSNSTDYSAIPVGPHVENRVFGLPDPEPPAAAPVAPARLSHLPALAGLYALPSGDRLEVKVAPGGGARLAITALGPQAFPLLLGEEDEEDRQRMSAREQQVGEMLAALRAGNAEPLGKLRGEPPERAAAEAAAVLAPWRQRLGSWLGAEVLGNGSYGGHPYTYARLTFAKGPKLAEYLWSGMGIETVRFVDIPPAILFIPQPDGSFANFDVRTGAIVHVRFEEPGGGAPAVLVATSPGGPVRAKRVG